VWAAVWLYRATNDQTYLTKAEQLYSDFGLGNWNGGFTWDQKISGLQVRNNVQIQTLPDTAIEYNKAIISFVLTSHLSLPDLLNNCFQARKHLTTHIYIYERFEQRERNY
jgi:hypothetical protein